MATSRLIRAIRIFYNGGRITRTNQELNEYANVAPEPIRTGQYRYDRSLPIVFSPLDPGTLYFAANVLFKTTDGGRSWQVISPDLTRESPEIPANLGAFSAGDPEKGKHRGTIYALAPSFKEPGTLWAGTDDGLIQITRDGGKAWKNVTPPQLTSWSKVSILEASHFDAGTVYAAVNRFRLDDLNPHIYRTRDFRRQLAGDCLRATRQRSDQRCARRSRTQGLALRGFRDFCLRFL